MLAARFVLRRAAPALRQVRSYAEAAAGAPQMSFTFASPNEVQPLRRLGLSSTHTHARARVHNTVVENIHIYTLLYNTLYITIHCALLQFFIWFTLTV